MKTTCTTFLPHTHSCCIRTISSSSNPIHWYLPTFPFLHDGEVSIISRRICSKGQIITQKEKSVCLLVCFFMVTPSLHKTDLGELEKRSLIWLLKDQDTKVMVEMLLCLHNPPPLFRQSLYSDWDTSLQHQVEQKKWAQLQTLPKKPLLGGCH